MKLFRIFLSFFVIAGLIWGGSLFFPHTYSVDRKVVIQKPVSEVYAFMSDLRNWEKWSLWNNTTDSSITFFYGKRSDSTGGRHYFNGELLGSGRFLIDASAPDEFISYNLYMHGGNINAKGSFRFKAISTGSTELHWIDSGDVGDNPILRYMLASKISSTEKAFDEGLQRIKEELSK